MRRDDVGKIGWNLRKKSSFTFIFFGNIFICSEKFNSISNDNLFPVISEIKCCLTECYRIEELHFPVLVYLNQD